MNYLEQVVFILLAGSGSRAVSVYLDAMQIRLSKDKDMSGNKGERWKNLLLLAFGQKKMFRNTLVTIATKRSPRWSKISLR